MRVPRRSSFNSKQFQIPKRTCTLSVCALRTVPKWQHTRTIKADVKVLIYVCVADLICEQTSGSVAERERTRVRRNEHRLGSQKHRLTSAIDRSLSASSNCCASRLSSMIGTRDGPRRNPRSSRNPACYFFCSWARSGSAVSCSSACSIQEGMLLEGISCFGE
jgi:hypothetical protein